MEVRKIANFLKRQVSYYEILDANLTRESCGVNIM